MPCHSFTLCIRVDRPAVVEEAVVADDAGAHTGFSEAQERMFTLMTGELSHDMGLRLIIRSIEQLHKDPAWPHCATAITEDVQALIDKYGITSGSGMASRNCAPRYTEIISFFVPQPRRAAVYRLCWRLCTSTTACTAT